MPCMNSYLICIVPILIFLPVLVFQILSKTLIIVFLMQNQFRSGGRGVSISSLSAFPSVSTVHPNWVHCEVPKTYTSSPSTVMRV